MKFAIYLKSYTDAPDYEDEVEANSKEEAVRKFALILSKYGWDDEEIAERVEQI